VKNKEIAEIFRGIANILEIKGENIFRIRAYARAAQNIEGLAKTPLIFLVPPACQSRKSDTAKYALDVA